MTQDELRKPVRYDESTGHLYWLHSRPGRDMSKPLGHVEKGHRRATINYVRYQVHHLVWLYFYGYLPDLLDHINGNGDDNRIENLREATTSENAQNQRKGKRTGRSGFLGVTYRPDRKTNPYRATIKINDKAIVLGQYPTPEEAHQVYLKAKAELHPFGEIAKEQHVI